MADGKQRTVTKDNAQSLTALAESPSASQTPSPSSPGSTDVNLNTGTITTDDSPSPTGKAGKGGSNSTKTTHGPKHTMFAPTDPAGSVVMGARAPLAPTQLYKIGDTVTWKWNYTNLLGKPTAIDVLASVAVVSRTYTLTQNMTFATQGAFTWDTNAYQQEPSIRPIPLPVEQYTLIIFDADSGPSATVDPGYLASFAGFTFGMYTPQPYQDLNAGWQCASCSSLAPSDAVDRRAVGFALTMCAVTVLSFTWFVTGFGGLTL